MESFYFEGHCYACKNCSYKELQGEGVDCPELNETYKCKLCGEPMQHLTNVREDNGRI